MFSTTSENCRTYQQKELNVKRYFNLLFQFSSELNICDVVYLMKLGLE